MAAIFASVYMLSVIYPGSLSCTSEYKSGFGLIPMPTNLGMRLKFTHGHNLYSWFVMNWVPIKYTVNDCFHSSINNVQLAITY